jgi:hypothetical protein
MKSQLFLESIAKSGILGHYTAHVKAQSKILVLSSKVKKQSITLPKQSTWRLGVLLY